MQQILDDKAIDRALTRISHEILERNKGTENLVLIGIPTRGEFLAARICAKIEEFENITLPTGTVDATLYRDDLNLKDEQPSLKETDIPISIAGKTLVLVDDVLYTGRTIRSALNALMDYGRPAAIQLAVLVDRGHRELPIKADYVGKNIPTAPNQGVGVRLSEIDDRDEVLLIIKEDS